MPRSEEILVMLCWIAILGGVLIMMGQHSRSEALFYYFRLAERCIGAFAAGGVVCTRLYSVREPATGRSEIDDQCGKVIVKLVERALNPNLRRFRDDGPGLSVLENAKRHPALIAASSRKASKAR